MNFQNYGKLSVLILMVGVLVAWSVKPDKQASRWAKLSKAEMEKIVGGADSCVVNDPNEHPNCPDGPTCADAFCFDNGTEVRCDDPDQQDGYYKEYQGYPYLSLTGSGKKPRDYMANCQKIWACTSMCQLSGGVYVCDQWMWLGTYTQQNARGTTTRDCPDE